MKKVPHPTHICPQTRRAARAMYDVSDGKVLLLAAVEPVTDNTGNNDASNNLLDMSGHRFRKTRRGTSGGRGAGVAAARQWRRRSNLAAEASTEVEVEVFPEDKFRFTIESHVMVLAETQTIAEDFFFTFEVCTTGKKFKCFVRRREGAG